MAPFTGKVMDDKIFLLTSPLMIVLNGLILFEVFTGKRKSNLSVKPI
ncbi:hypothetical protein BTN49_0039 [Candidatus Enterovibrio escicola]|uniref:Uncharacterized protein n=1 Tax=Candidatus Enterovibrio escicola TaxID=1927127 RepID=A0A2A5T7T6_9GAMM|nr:hypothetical protein BTN49_0039 [Candidatus Enterovibrio escacola]